MVLYFYIFYFPIQKVFFFYVYIVGNLTVLFVYFSKSFFWIIHVDFLYFDLHYILLLMIFCSGGNEYLQQGGGKKCGHRSKGNVLTLSSHIVLFMY